MAGADAGPAGDDGDSDQEDAASVGSAVNLDGLEDDDLPAPAGAE